MNSSAASAALLRYAAFLYVGMVCSLREPTRLSRAVKPFFVSFDMNIYNRWRDPAPLPVSVPWGVPAAQGLMPPGAPPYPFNAFHLATASTAREIQTNVKGPDAMIGVSLLTAMSVSCMGLISVGLPTGQLCSVSLNSLVMADSGERKTATDNLVMAPVQQRDRLRAKKYEEDIAEYNAEKAVWDAVKSGIRACIVQATKRGEPVDQFGAEMANHMKVLPIKPRERRLIRQDMTGRAIIDAIEGDRELIALLSNEGEIILRSDAMRQVGMLNMLWDAAPVISFDRAKGSIVARNARGTVSFMVQEAVLEKYLERRGKVVRGSGHWARYLVAWPASTQGYRFMSFDDSVWEHLPQFHARLVELMDEYDRRRESGDLEPEILEFDDDARAMWITVSNHIEAQLQPLQYLSDIKDFASKSMEIVGRIAALFHKFSKQEGKISVDTLNRACQIIEWHLHEFKRIFSPKTDYPPPQGVVDAETLETYLYRVYWLKRATVAQKNCVLQNGPIRPAKRFGIALDYLIVQKRIEVFTEPNGQSFIRLNPNYFGGLLISFGV